MNTNSRRPLIGIPSGSFPSSDPGVKTFRYNGNYTAALAAAGAAPVAIPLNVDEDALVALFDRLDGLCLAGGGDIDPARYGEEAQPGLREVDPARDAVELWLARQALDRDLPLLAICRGIQLLNVAAGGTLYQDVPSQRPGSVRHDNKLAESPWERPVHAVQVAAESRLASHLAACDLRTNSFHHQAVRQVGAGLEPVAWAEDGLVEAVEVPGRRFACGVQWHPEAMTRVDASARRLFEAFVQAAAS